ncbi:hypothetical protein [Leptospira sp. GIMC2001]|uniref:hypothetical protein n=1 Tax=Leptospira sp. GIMC2001 TaxID=1513297 RepID=UPI00234BBF61|nr:hypothetical protein [Leptospira sp. GIMC2001]WCL49995.1 hypothetical protein O4O04_04025 [Leptospira sp. GIMC2001]
MKKQLQLTVAILAILFSAACSDSGKVDQSEADLNLLTGLVLGQQRGQADVLSTLTEIRGYWSGGFCSGGNCTGFTTNVSIAQDPSGFGVWASGNGYQRIISVDNQARNLIVQYRPNDSFSPSRYTRILWTAPTTSSCENGASKCFFYCTVFPNFTTLEAAQNADLSSYSSANPATTGCGSFGWSKALFVSSNPTNWN